MLEGTADENEFVSTEEEPVELVAFNHRESIAVVTCALVLWLLAMENMLTNNS